MAETSAPGKKREIPWLNVVRFHKEIAARAERDFFSLPTASPHSERWTTLLKFEPDSMAGPWRLSREQIVSRDFRPKAAEQLFLGGPCYEQWVGKNRDGSPRYAWHPVLYREVRWRDLDGGASELVPEQGKWSVNPLFLTLMESRETRIDETVDLVSIVLEEVKLERERTNVSASNAIRSAFVRKVPDLRTELEARPHRGVPPAWVLFAPLTKYSFNRHLMDDYRGLEARLAAGVPNDGADTKSYSEETGELGGLRILDGFSPAPSESQAKFEPLVELNRSQRQAVESILTGQSLTVVSGPPGCGKSRVVEGTILNAWAAGWSVLFASQNKQAVEVIRNRFDTLDDDFRVTIRAGSQKEDRVVGDLNDIARDGARERPASDGRWEAQKDKLERERAEIKRFLSTKYPQRVEEGVSAALNAYHKALELGTEIQVEERDIQDEWVRLGLPQASCTAIRKVSLETERWLDGVAEHVEAEARDEERRRELGEELRRLEQKRDDAAMAAGFRSGASADWSWLASDPDASALAEWKLSLDGVLGTQVGAALAPIAWREEYSRWSSQVSASSARDKADAFAEVLRGATNQFLAYRQVLKKARRHLDTALKKVLAESLERRDDLPLPLLVQWSAEYSKFVTLERNSLDWMPWSRRQEARRKLRQTTDQLRPYLPVTTWRDIGSLNDDGYARLAGHVGALRTWKTADDAWTKALDSMDEVLEPLRTRSVELGLPAIPLASSIGNWDIEGHARLAIELSILADEASKAWAQRDRQVSVTEQIGEVVEGWRRLVREVPLVSTWVARGVGRGFASELATLGESFSVESWSAVRDAMARRRLASLERAWTRLADVQRECTDCEKQLDAVPPENTHLEVWRKTRPSEALVGTPRLDEIPTFHEQRKHLRTVTDLCDQREAFEKETRPSKSDQRVSEYHHAINKLKETWKIANEAGLLAEAEDASVKAVVAALSADGASMWEWDTDAIRGAFSCFSPTRLRAEIVGRDNKLKKLAFEAATAERLIGLDTDAAAWRAVDELKDHVSRSRSDGEFDEDEFRCALRAASVWTVRSQSTQHVPIAPDLFDIVIIDEASQCTLTNLLPLLYRGKRLVMIGDPEQLSAIWSVDESQEHSIAQQFGVAPWMAEVGHTMTGYEAAVRVLPRRSRDVVFLREHYRSHPQIIGFANRSFYGARLKLRKPLDASPAGLKGVFPVTVHGNAVRGRRGRSWANEQEARGVVEQVVNVREDPGKRGWSIGVVTPFKEQATRVEELLRQRGVAGNVDVGTTHAFQGDEREVMIFSPVVAEGISPGAMSWMSEPHNLINVAWTRARTALIVVADLEYLARQRGVLREIAQYCEDIQKMRRAKMKSPAEEMLFNWMVVEGWNPGVHVNIGDLEVDFSLQDDGIQLVIEVDGGRHRETREEDEVRDAYLAERGYRVLRVTARDVFGTPHEVIKRIADVLNE